MNIELIGYCGVDCSVCTDFINDKCPCCRKSTWRESTTAGKLLRSLCKFAMVKASALC